MESGVIGLLGGKHACAALTVSRRKISRRKAGLSIIRRRPLVWDCG